MLQLNLKILALFLKIETELNVGGGGGGEVGECKSFGCIYCTFLVWGFFLLFYLDLKKTLQLLLDWKLKDWKYVAFSYLKYLFQNKMATFCQYWLAEVSHLAFFKTMLDYFSQQQQPRTEKAHKWD